MQDGRKRHTVEISIALTQPAQSRCHIAGSHCTLTVGRAEHADTDVDEIESVLVDLTEELASCVLGIVTGKKLVTESHEGGREITEDDRHQGLNDARGDGTDDADEIEEEFVLG